MLEKTETTVPILRHRDDGDTVGVLGGRTRFLVAPQDVGDAYAILEQVIPAGHGPPLHVHRHETEVFYVVDGEFEITIGGQVVRAGPGSSACCPRDIPHTFRNVSDQPARLHLTIIPGRFGRYFQDVDAIPDGDRDAIRALVASYDVEILD